MRLNFLVGIDDAEIICVIILYVGNEGVYLYFVELVASHFCKTMLFHHVSLIEVHFKLPKWRSMVE